MTENNTSPDPQSDSPQSPSRPEKHSSFSKGLENIILFGAGIAFITSLFSKDKNTETKAPHKDTQKEIKEPLERTEHPQEIEKKENKSTLSDFKSINRIRELSSNICRKACLRIDQNAGEYSHKDMLKKLKIAMIASPLAFFASLIITSHWGDILNILHPIFKYLFSDNIPLGISISLATITAISILFAKYFVTRSQKGISSLTNRYSMFTLAALAILGASSALLVPSYTNLFREPGHTSSQQDSTRDNSEKVQETPTSTPSSTGNKAAEVEQKSTSDLRLHLLYITGGIIAILGLIETNRKNSQDHIRQVHAARRERYIEAVDKLSSKNAPVRLGGVYALFGLIDEWLDDDNIDKETRLKEGQVIVNNLCSYVRSPFTLAENRELIEKAATLQACSRNLSKDKAKLREEQEIRQAIFSEISVRIANLAENSPTDEYWNKFNYNFSKSNIFYSLNELTFCNPNFSNAEFNGLANFTGSRFLGKAIFKNTIFNSEAYMSDTKSAKTIFEGDADFTGSIFKGKATFKNATFNSLAHFSDFDSAKTTFDSEVDFTGSTFIGDAIFRNTTFTLAATFSSEYSSRTNFEAGSDFSLSTFSHNANFSNVNFHQYSNFELTSFGGMAKFVKTNFYGSAQFSIWGGPQYSQDYSFSGDANFTDAYFKEGASFTERHFEKSAVFRNVIFDGPAYFAEGKIADRGIFTNTIFKDSSRFILYNFGTSTDFKEAKFSTNRAHEFDRAQNIALGSVPIDIGWPQNQIPLGSRYGLLNSWDSKTKSFTVTSDPAK